MEVISKLSTQASVELFFGSVGELSHEVCGCDSALGVYVEFDLHQILLNGAHQVDDQLNDEVLIVLLEHFVGDQQRNVIVLTSQSTYV